MKPLVNSHKQSHYRILNVDVLFLIAIVLVLRVNDLVLGHTKFERKGLGSGVHDGIPMLGALGSPLVLGNHDVRVSNIFVRYVVIQEKISLLGTRLRWSWWCKGRRMTLGTTAIFRTAALHLGSLERRRGQRWRRWNRKLGFRRSPHFEGRKF